MVDQCYLDVSESDWLSLVLETQLFNGQILLEHLGGAVERHVDVVEDWDALPLYQVLHHPHSTLQLLILSLGNM